MEQSYVIRNDRVIGKTVPNINYNYSTCPIGSIFAFSSERIPLGFFICDGASYKVAEYPDLYAVIGNTYGGDDVNFNVPNLIDKFIQGSTTSGTEKEAGLPNITGSIGNSGSANDQFLSDSTSASIKTKGALSITGYASKTSMANGSDNYNTPTGFGFDASKSNAIYGKSNTVQPPALTMVYIIKAKHTNEGQDEGVSDSVIEYVDNYVSDSNSYSTEETLTGGKWIDGKPIYRKCFNGSWTIPNSTWSDIITVPNIEQLIRIEIIGDKKIWNGYWEIDTNNTVRFYTPNGTTFNLCILEYTKTTD